MILGIIGAGGLGREVHIIAKKINAVSHRWDDIVFQDDNRSVTEVTGVRCYGMEELIRTFEDLEVVIAIGEPAVRENIYHRWKEKGVRIATLIHPGVYLDETTKIGEGTVICEGCTVTSCVEIGENVYIQPHAVIGHDIHIGKHSVIGSMVQIGGSNQIGERSFFGFLSATKQGLTIGNDVICSGGAIVFKNLPDDVIAVGNPARVVKINTDKRVFK